MLTVGCFFSQRAHHLPVPKHYLVMALPKKYRLASEKDFKFVFSRGKTIRNGFLFIRFHKNQLGYGRLGIVIPAKISKKAVLRNRIKRLISEALKNFDFKSHSLDIVVVGSENIVEKSYQEIKREVSKIINRTISQ